MRILEIKAEKIIIRTDVIIVIFSVDFGIYGNGDGWHENYFPCRGELWTKAFNRESQDIYRCLVTQFYNLEILREFCKGHPSSHVGENEYNFFMNGHAADYWIRFITRENDYNLYLKGYKKNCQHT